MVARSARPAALLVLVAALAACSLTGSSGGSSTTTLPTLAPSAAATTLAPATAPPTAPPTSPPLTAPGPPSTGTTIPDLVTTLPPGVATSTSLPGPARYVDEPGQGALQLGHKGTRVQTMQGQLLELGYQLGVDGYFGRGTEAAVRAFQQAQGINPDGIAGPDTLARLAQLVPAG